eukprot:86008_1
METTNLHHLSSENKASDNIQETKSTSKPPSNIDFGSTQECDEKKPDINNCACVNRIIHVLKYYASLNTKTNQQGQLTFINFIQTLYKHYLNDMIHLTTVHEQDLQDINNILFDGHG